MADLDAIRRRLRVADLLRRLNWRIRSSKRADCGLCQGSTRSTIAFTDHQWCCHRCHAGGDIFALYTVAYGCAFPVAVCQLAVIAGVSNSEIDQKQLHRERQHRERQERAATERRELEKRERILSRDLIHWLEKRMRRLSQQLGACQQNDAIRSSLTNIHGMLRRELLAYTLLCFGSAADRAEYTSHPERRPELLRRIQCCGFVRDDDGKLTEVLL